MIWIKKNRLWVGLGDIGKMSSVMIWKIWYHDNNIFYNLVHFFSSLWIKVLTKWSHQSRLFCFWSWRLNTIRILHISLNMHSECPLQAETCSCTEFPWADLWACGGRDKVALWHSFKQHLQCCHRMSFCKPNSLFLSLALLSAWTGPTCALR